MLNKRQLLSNLKKDIKALEFKVEHKLFFNFINVIAIGLIKLGIAIDYAIPFILSIILIFNMHSKQGQTAFAIDQVTEKAKIETFDTSTGIHMENRSFDYDYDNRSFEHSTAWYVNEYGLYERTVTTYQINDSIDLNNLDSIFKMTKEQVEKSFTILNIEKIKKNKLTEEDKIYDEDMLIIINYIEDEENFIVREETSGENLSTTIWTIFLSLCWGNNFRIIGKIFVKTYVRDKLKAQEANFRPLTKEEFEKLKKILELKKENLSLLEPTEQYETNNENTESIRRIRRI